MVIVGAKGFAKEILEVLYSELNYSEEKLFFFDNVNKDLPDKLFAKFSILRNYKELVNFFELYKEEDFVLGLGVPAIRRQLFNEFVALGAKPFTLISKYARIGSFSNVIEEGTSIMQGSVITNNIKIGKACLINLNCTIGHDSVLGDFVELSPNVNISGNCTIGDLTSVGTNAVLIPGVSIGRNVVVGAGTVVTKDIPDNSVVVGVPGKVIKTNPDIA